VLRFRKVEGLGNDFLLLDRTGQSREEVEAEVEHLRSRAPDLCHRRRGVGADGVLVVGPAAKIGRHAAMWVINADGSRPEMCGNGIRCVAQHLAALTGRDDMTIETDAGPKRCRVFGDGADVDVEVDMGPGEDLGPKQAAGRAFAGVSMGNPHAVAFVADPHALARTEGPKVEVDAVFREGTNVEYARIDDDQITLWVWERGVGITQACGTGACAAACVAVWTGQRPADTPLVVQLPGGRLYITVPSDRNAGVLMRGPARAVFDGVVDAADDGLEPAQHSTS
jgi:diaminopimelate epimerase